MEQPAADWSIQQFKNQGFVDCAPAITNKSA